jgi:hypothetical protein
LQLWWTILAEHITRLSSEPLIAAADFGRYVCKNRGDMFWLIVIFALILSILTGYTMAIQGTTIALGRLLVYGSSLVRGTGLQDAITPKMQSVRNIAVIILFLVLFAFVTYTYAWYHAIWVLVVTFLASTVFPIILGMRAGSQRIVSIIITDMKRRKNAYIKSGDELRSNAISDLIDRLEKIPQEQIMKEVKR